MLIRLFFLLLPLAIPTSAIAQRDMHEVVGKECRLTTDVPREQAIEVAARIDEFAVLVENFYASVGMEPREEKQIVVRLFASFDDFSEYRTRDGGNAYFSMYMSSTLNAIVAYHDPDDPFLTSKLLGLCSTVVMRRYCPEPPEWVRRGFECIFHGYEFDPGKPARRELPLLELVVLQEALTRNEYFGAQELVKRNQQTFEDRLPKGTKMHNLLPAAQGWGLVHYFLELAPDAEKAMFREFMKKVNAKGAKASKAELTIRDWPEFEERWKKAMLAIPAKVDTAEKHLRIADGHMDVLNYSFAVPAYEAAYKKDRTLPGLPYKLGFALKKAGFYDGAIRHLLEAASLDPKSPLPHYQLARLHSYLDAKMAEPKPANPAKALEHAKIAVELGGEDNPVYLGFLARCQLMNDDKKSALATARKALAAADKDDKAFYEKLVKEMQKGS